MTNNKILYIITSHGVLGSTGKPTGWYLPELAHPYNIMTKAGYEITLASPLGGKPPVRCYKEPPSVDQN
jgi:putative intracellular protease/amidase